MQTLAVSVVVILFCASLLLVDRGFFWIDDFQTNNLPGWCEVARAWRAGELPLLSVSSWRAGALAAEYPYGTFSPVLTAFSLVVFSLHLPLPMAAATFSIGHLAILAAGAFRLARCRGLSAALALLVALVSSLNGWIVLWGARAWLPCLVSFAWLPWLWWALERTRTRAGWLRFLPAGLFLYLLISAGWPFTVLMAGIVSAWLAARALNEQRRLLAPWPILAAWLVGLALSAPSWLMLLEYMPHTLRGQRPGLAMDSTWIVPLSSLPGLVFPGLIAFWNVYGTWKLHLSAELCGGLAPLVLLAATLGSSRGRSLLKELRWEVGLLAGVLLLTISPSLGNFRWSFRWLPLFFLVLALLAAEALARWRAAAPRLGAWASLLLAAVWLRALLLGLDSTSTTRKLGLALAGLCFAWYLADRYLAPASGVRPWLPALVTALACWLTYRAGLPFREVPAWTIEEQICRPEPLRPAVRYLSVHLAPDMLTLGPLTLPPRVAGVGTALYPGNTAMYSGLDFVNGYSPFGPRGLDEVFRFELQGAFHPDSAARILAAETGPDGLLELAGVDGLVLADRFEAYRRTLAQRGWKEVARLAGATVLHRAGRPSPRVRALEHAEVTADRAEVLGRLAGHRSSTPVPLVLLTEAKSRPAGRRCFVPARVEVIEDSRNRAVVDVTPQRAAGDVLVVFSRPWLPGYRATCAGRTIPVEVLDLVLPAVRLPAGACGRLTLEYRPRSLVLGMGMAGVATCLLGLGLLTAGWHHFRRGRSKGFSASA